MTEPQRGAGEKRYRGQRGPNKIKKRSMPGVSIRLTEDVVAYFSRFENPTGEMRRVLAQHARGASPSETSSVPPVATGLSKPIVLHSADHTDAVRAMKVRLNPSTSEYLNSFPYPEKLIADILDWYASEYGGVIQEEQPLDDDAPILEYTAIQIAPHDMVAHEEGALSQIRSLLQRGNDRTKGYGSLKLAALAAVRSFGSGWLEKEVASPSYAKRIKLRNLVVDNLPAGYSNKSVAWARFQQYASEAHVSDRP